jgi:hypothetical protein
LKNRTLTTRRNSWVPAIQEFFVLAASAMVIGVRDIECPARDARQGWIYAQEWTTHMSMMVGAHQDSGDKRTA